MHERLLEVLACPLCRASVALASAKKGETGDRVHEGTLTCMGCGASYSIVRGIPRMLQPASNGAERGDGSLADRTVSHFVKEFTVLAEDDADIGRVDDVRYHFYTRTGIDGALLREPPRDPASDASLRTVSFDSSFLVGKRVLDGGCGPGRFTEVAADAAAHVVGLDLGDHVDRAAARCRHLTNVDFVQGSVLQPPFRRESFDYVFTLGVLHHTPDPRGGCIRLAELVVPGGAMSVWVYPPEYWGHSVQRPLGQRLHRTLSRLPHDAAFRVCDRWLYPLGRAQMWLAQRRWTKLLGAPLFVVGVPRHPSREVMVVTIYDHYCPPIISTHTYEEVRGWLEEAGFERLRSVPVPTAWFAEKPALATG